MSSRWLMVGGCLAVLIVSGVLIGRPFQPSTAHQASPAQAATCRLPVYVRQTNVGGFLTVPGYTFSQDPKFSQGSLSYDATLGKWLPVEPSLISRDGNWYAYRTPTDETSSTTSAIHLVDRRGVDRTVWTGPGYAHLIGWTDEGAVFVHLSADLHFVAEQVIRVPAGTVRSLVPIAGDVVRTDASGMWATRQLPTAPLSDTKAPLHATLLRADLTTGARVTWWEGTIPGLILLLGFDGSQHPVLYIVGDVEGHDRLVVLTAPHAETEIATDTAALHFFPSGGVGDGHGVWFGDIEGLIWLWDPTDGLRRVAQLPSPVSLKPNVAAIAGPCR